MGEFFLECIQPANLPATVLMGLVLLYWLMMISGVVGMDLFDLGMDFDAEIDVDADAGIDGSGHGGGIVADVLTFFHLGEVPVMIFASFFVLFFWAATLVSNHFFNPDWSWLVSAYFLIPEILISLLLTKIVIMPMTPLFRSMMKKAESRIIGARGLVSTTWLDGEFGQVVIENDGPPIVVNARTENGQRLDKHQAVRILRLHPTIDAYFVAPAKPEKPA